MEKYKKLSKLDLLKSNFFGILSFVMIMTGGAYAATTITGVNIWTTTAASGDSITADAWNALVGKHNYASIKDAMGCTSTISLGGLEVCSANSRLNATWTGVNDYRVRLAGGYYSWYDAQIACQYGYHLPSDSEWRTLLAASSNNYATLRSNLGLGLSGYRDRDDGSFLYQGSIGYYWSSTARDDTYARLRAFHSRFGYLSSLDKSYLFSVRCIKD